MLGTVSSQPMAMLVTVKIFNNCGYGSNTLTSGVLDPLLYTVFCHPIGHTCIIAQPHTLENLHFISFFIKCLCDI